MEWPMSVMSSGRCLTVALAVALSASACAKAPPTEKGHKEAAMPEDTSQSRTVGGYTYTTAAVIAQLGPHRYAFPANFYDDQIGPSVGGGIALSFIWPGLQAAAPGDRPTRSMEDHYRTVTASIDYLDAVPASELLPRLSSTEATTEAGSVNRNDPRRRLDLRKAGTERFGLIPYAIDEERMAQFGNEYQKQFGEPVTRNPRKEDEWYIARAANGMLATFIKCDQPEGGNEGLAIQGDRLVPDESVKVSSCTHYFVDSNDNLGVTLFYPRVLLKDWKAMEEATRAALAKYKVR